jgi:hypothetical protein
VQVERGQAGDGAAERVPDETEPVRWVQLGEPVELGQDDGARLRPGEEEAGVDGAVGAFIVAVVVVIITKAAIIIVVVIICLVLAIVIAISNNSAIIRGLRLADRVRISRASVNAITIAAAADRGIFGNVVATVVSQRLL